MCSINPSFVNASNQTKPTWMWWACPSVACMLVANKAEQGSEPMHPKRNSMNSPYLKPLLCSIGADVDGPYNKIWLSKPQVQEEHTTSFMHIFGTNKVPRVVLWFSWAGTHFERNWNQRATRARHSRTTRHGQPCRCGRPCRCGWPCQVRPHLPRGSCLVQSTSSPAGTTWMNEIDQGNVGLIKWMRSGSLGSMGPLVRPINHHNCHSKAILGIPERRWFITRHRVGPAAPPNRHTRRNRPMEQTLNHLRSNDLEHTRREAVNHRASRTPGSGRTCDIGPMRSPTSLAYKRHLTLTGMDTQCWSILFPPFCSPRVGLM
jgi:hypothetical protein